MIDQKLKELLGGSPEVLAQLEAHDRKMEDIRNSTTSFDQQMAEARTRLSEKIKYFTELFWDMQPGSEAIKYRSDLAHLIFSTDLMAKDQLTEEEKNQFSVLNVVHAGLVFGGYACLPLREHFEKLSKEMKNR